MASLYQLMLVHKNIPFQRRVQDDIFGYLDSLRRTECEDSLHRWTETYNISVSRINLSLDGVLT